MASSQQKRHELAKVIAREVGHISRGCRSGRSHNPNIHEQAIEDALASLVEQLETLRAALDEARKPADLRWLTEKLHQLERAATPPSVDELREVVAAHVRDIEPVATSEGVASAVHAFLAARITTRLPLPGEYVDPQPAEVDA